MKIGRKLTLYLVPIILIGFILSAPFTLGSFSEIYLNTGDQLVWHQKAETFYENGTKADSAENYYKLNITDKVLTKDYLNVSWDIYFANASDYENYNGTQNESIWQDAFYGLNFHTHTVFRNNKSIDEKFFQLFNTLDLDLRDITSLPKDNQTGFVYNIDILVNPTLFTVMILYTMALLGNYTQENSNSSSISNLKMRSLNYSYKYSLAII